MSICSGIVCDVECHQAHYRRCLIRYFNTKNDKEQLGDSLLVQLECDMLWSHAPIYGSPEIAEPNLKMARLSEDPAHLLSLPSATIDSRLLLPFITTRLSALGTRS
jgi:hypothetical protein